jgi:hypothetical protein
LFPERGEQRRAIGIDWRRWRGIRRHGKDRRPFEVEFERACQAGDLDRPMIVDRSVQQLRCEIGHVARLVARPGSLKSAFHVPSPFAAG